MVAMAAILHSNSLFSRDIDMRSYLSNHIYHMK